MAFRRGGAGKRRDANEAAIVEALRSIGCEVWQISGRGVPDLLVWRPCVRRYYPMEVKTATGKQKPSQVGTPWPIVRSVDQAIRVVNGLPAEAEAIGAKR